MRAILQRLIAGVARSYSACKPGRIALLWEPTLWERAMRAMRRRPIAAVARSYSTRKPGRVVLPWERTRWERAMRAIPPQE